MDKITAMKIFLKVSELGSFTKAAEQLNIPKSSTTNAIQELEYISQVKLMNRTTRKVDLTTEGLSYLERCKSILSDLDEMETMFHSNPKHIKGKIRVSMTSVTARDVVIPKLGQFCEMYPHIEIEIIVSDQRLDLIREGIDCAVRSGNYHDPRLVEHFICEMKVVNAVGKKYAKKFGIPKKLEDLKKHRIINYAQNFGSEEEGFEYFDGQKTHEIKMKSTISVSSIDAYRAACLAGFGICQNPELGIRKLLDKGDLIEVLPTYQCKPYQLKIVYPKKREQAKRVRAFIEWVEPVIKNYIQ